MRPVSPIASIRDCGLLERLVGLLLGTNSLHELAVFSSSSCMTRFSLGDIAADSQQIARNALLIEKRNLLGMQISNAACGMNRLLRNVEHLSAAEHCPIDAIEELGLLRRKNIGITASDQPFARPADIVLDGYTIEPDPTQVLRLFHEDHVRDIFDDGVGEPFDVAQPLVLRLKLGVACGQLLQRAAKFLNVGGIR